MSTQTITPEYISEADRCGASTLDALYSAGFDATDQALWYPYAMDLTPQGLHLHLESENEHGMAVTARLSLTVGEYTGRYLLGVDSISSVEGETLFESVARYNGDAFAAALLNPAHGAPQRVREHLMRINPERARVLGIFRELVESYSGAQLRYVRPVIRYDQYALTLVDDESEPSLGVDPGGTLMLFKTSCDFDAELDTEQGLDVRALAGVRLEPVREGRMGS